jgi:hypothetical protein
MTRSELEIIIKKRAAIVVTLFAALLAISTLLGGSNSSKILGNTIAANNQWAWYQAKNVRSVIYATTADTTKGSLSEHYREEARRMKADMDDLAAKAKALEVERDLAKAKSPYFTYAGSLLQIGIVLSTAAILAVAMPLFWGSVGVGSLGAVLFFYAQFGV